MVKKSESNSAKKSTKKTRGGSVSNSKTSSRKRKVVDPMIVSAKTAEKDNVVLDEALADLEMEVEQREVLEEYPEEEIDYPEEEVFDEEYYNQVQELVSDNDYDSTVEDIWSISDDEDMMPKKKTKKQSVKSQEKARTSKNEQQKTAADEFFVDRSKDAKKKDYFLDDEEETPKYKKEKKLKKNGKPKMKIWKKILIVLLLVILAGVGYVGWYAFTALNKTTSIFEGNALDILTPTPLAQDEYGRTNILVFGTAGDDSEHPGAQLSDSILVVSINQEKKSAKTFSIPRDLWVNYTVSGEESMYCVVGYKGKINAEYFCALNAFDDDKDKSSRYFARKVSEITGLNIQYYAAVDWTVLTSTVDALGGIDVDVHGAGSEIYDVCQGITIPTGMNYQVNGDLALKIARARGACGGYGLPNSNFDREINQQRIINAIKDKALSAGVLANPSTVLGMLDGFGNNIKTNVTMSEVRTIIDIALGMSGNIESISTQEQFTTGMYGSQSIVIPRGANTEYESTLYRYTNFQKYLREELDSEPEEEVDPNKCNKDVNPNCSDEE